MSAPYYDDDDDDDKPVDMFARLGARLRPGLLNPPGTFAAELADAEANPDRPWPKSRRAGGATGGQRRGAGGETQRPTEKPPYKIDLGAWRLDRFTQGDPPPQQFLLQPLFPLGVAGVLFGPGGIGKSLAVLDLCLSVARAAVMPPGNLGFVPGPFGGHVPREGGGSVIYLSLEDSAQEIHRRVASLDPKNTREGLPIFVVPGIELPAFDPVLVREEGRAAALTRFAEHGLEELLDSIADETHIAPTLLALDPIGDFINGDEDSANYVKPLMRRLREVAQSRNVTILGVGHTAKTIDPSTPTMRGSGAWIANSRFAFALTPPQRDTSTRQKADQPAEGTIWGCLVKANHRGAPVGKRRLFKMDPTSGRLIDVTGQDVPEPVEAPSLDLGSLADVLVEVCRQAGLAGEPVTRTGKRGLFARRTELHPDLATLTRAKLEEVVEWAINGGLIRVAEGGRVPGAMEVLDQD